MDAKGRLWFPWLHFLSYLGWLEGWWVPFLRGGKQGNGQRRMCVDQRGPREGVRAGSHPTRKRKGYRTRGKCRNSSSWRGAGVQDSSSLRDSHAGTALGRVGEGEGESGVLGA